MRRAVYRRELCVVGNICVAGEAFNSRASPPLAYYVDGISVVPACRAIGNGPRASKRSLRVPGTIEAEPAQPCTLFA